MSRGTPYKLCHRVVSAPPLSSSSRENHGPNEESGDGNRTVTQMCWTSVGQMQACFLVRMAPVSARKSVEYSLLPLEAPYPRAKEREGTGM